MINFLRILLLPISLIYLSAISLRNFFYDKGIFKSHKISKPVISIGNISTGGTGKSPFTVFLTEYFIHNNIIPAVISRGYKGKSKNIEIVFDGSEITSEHEKCGDEPLMIANILSLCKKKFFVAKGSDRVKTAEFVIDKFNPDVLILDDAYQHRKIKRDLDIVLIDAEEFIDDRFLHSVVLPAGNLREYNMRRANIIIQNNKFKNFEKIDKLEKFTGEVFMLSYKVAGFFDLNNISYEIDGKDVRAFAGIAKPQPFFDELKKYNCNIIDAILFRDHHNYTIKDILKIKSKATKDNIFITTEKDFIKIKCFHDFLKYFNVLFMKIELNLENSDKFFEIVKDELKKYNY